MKKSQILTESDHPKTFTIQANSTMERTSHLSILYLKTIGNKYRIYTASKGKSTLNTQDMTQEKLKENGNEVFRDLVKCSGHN